MKDFKLPCYSEEEKENIFNDLKVGDELVKIEESIWTRSYEINFYKVIRRTQKGRIRLSNNELLEFLPRSYFIFDERIDECINKLTIEDQIISILSTIISNKRSFKDNLMYEDAVKLRKLLSSILDNYN